jgi:hypothetical protein
MLALVEECMSELFHGFKWIVVEALHQAELIYPCHDEGMVIQAIETLVNEYNCDPKDIAVLPLSSAIPFKFKKVERVEIDLTRIIRAS